MVVRICTSIYVDFGSAFDMLHLTTSTLAITLLLIHIGVADSHDCVASQSSLTDTYDDPIGGGDAGSAFIYNGLHYDSTFGIGPVNPYNLGSFAVSPPNLLSASGVSGNPRYLNTQNATISVLSGYTLLNELYYGCVSSDGAVPCTISLNGFDASGNAAGEVLLHYIELDARKLDYWRPFEAQKGFEYVNFTFRVTTSATSPFSIRMVFENIRHFNCDANRAEITGTVTTLSRASPT
ncbi:hypothetical protein LTS12_006475 [Elasticomyces elasticus]|nr:hypothetical protein LTS12_006475 [Elasticomyces elasticus]